MANPAPLASVIIPSRDNAELLGRAIRSVQSAQYPRLEIVVVDNGSSSAAQLRLLEDLARVEKAQVVRDPRAFNFSALVNAGRRAATGDVLILLNDDVESTEHGWAEELVAQSMRPEIGCVGALLLYPTLQVQHAGIILGINGGPGHAFRHSASGLNAADRRLLVVREVAAVTGACLAVRTTVFDEAGGFDEELPITMNDADFCLRVAKLGYRNIVTPHASLIHRESSSRGLDSTNAKLRRLQRETALFLRKWGAAAVEDPYLNPHLSRSHEDYRLRQL
jgi:GT2 family glycosyltransferase